jgi:acetolactate synthase-1/2/3 large subunit
MAFGYARASGKVGTYAVVPGPGLLNTTAALATAYATNAPVLCISGQVASDLIGRGFGLLHEIPDQLGILERLTKWAARIEHPPQTGRLVNEAFRQLRDGRPRPVGLEIPPDVLALETEVALPAADASPETVVPDPELIDKAAALLADAKKPLLFSRMARAGRSCQSQCRPVAPGKVARRVFRVPSVLPLTTVSLAGPIH